MREREDSLYRTPLRVGVCECIEKRGINAFHLTQGDNINRPKHSILSLAVLCDMKTNTDWADSPTFSDELITDVQEHQTQRELFFP